LLPGLAVPQVLVCPVLALYVVVCDACAAPCGPAVVAVVRSTELPPAPVNDELDPYERCPV